MRAGSEGATGCAWAVAAELAVAGKRNAFRHRCGSFGMLTDVQTCLEGAERRGCAFFIPLKKTNLISPGKSII